MEHMSKYWVFWMQLSMSRIIGFPKYDSVNILNPMTSHSYYKKKKKKHNRLLQDAFLSLCILLRNWIAFSRQGLILTAFQTLILIIFSKNIFHRTFHRWQAHLHCPSAERYRDSKNCWTSHCFLKRRNTAALFETYVAISTYLGSFFSFSWVIIYKITMLFMETFCYKIKFGLDSKA